MEQKEVEKEEEQKCNAINNIWEVLGRKWDLLILKNLHTGETEVHITRFQKDQFRWRDRVQEIQ